MIGAATAPNEPETRNAAVNVVFRLDAPISLENGAQGGVGGLEGESAIGREKQTELVHLRIAREHPGRRGPEATPRNARRT